MASPIAVELARQFVSWLEQRGLRKSAVKTYRFAMRPLARSYPLSRRKLPAPENLTEQDIDDFRDYL